MIETPKPAAPELERMLLGAALRNNEKLHEVLAVVKPEDFSRQEHRLILECMVEMLEAGKGLDPKLVADELSSQSNLARVGGAAYVLSLWDDVTARTSVQTYLATVKDCSRRRKLMVVCESSVAKFGDRGIPTRQSLSDVEGALLEVQAENTSSGPKHIFHGSDEHYAMVMERAKDQGQRVGASFGIESLDLDTTGMRKGEFWVLGGRPGEGKSAIALQSVLKNASEEKPVAFFSVEMSAEQVRERMWAVWSGIPFEKIRNPNRLNDSEKKNLSSAAAEVGKLPIYIDEDGGIDIGTLAARARLAIKREKAQLIVVDYIQIVGAAAKDERQRVSKVSTGLRLLAKSHEVPVLGLSQMPRPRDGNLNRWPTKFDLKESGTLEADAAGIVMIFREVDEETHLPTGNDVLVIPKQRFGPTTYENVTFLTNTLRYVERA